MLACGEAVDHIDLCQWWREYGFKNLQYYLKSVLGRGIFAREAQGLMQLYRWEEDCPYPLMREFAFNGMIPLSSLHLVQRVLTTGNYTRWLGLMTFLRPAELGNAVMSYYAATRGVQGGHFVFIPLWVPAWWFKKVWRALSRIPTNVFADNQFEILKRVIEQEKNR